MIIARKTKLDKDVHLLEDVDVFRISLVDKPANKTAFSIVKRNRNQPEDKRVEFKVDGEGYPGDNCVSKSGKVDKGNEGTERPTPKGTWVRTKDGKRYFIAERKARVNDKTGRANAIRKRPAKPDKSKLKDKNHPLPT